MAKGKGKPPDLSNAEWEVMQIVWQNGPLALGDIYAALGNTHKWAYPTVKTLVRRMAKKGWLEHERVGSSFLYRAAVARTKAVRSAVREFSRRVLGGVLSPFVAYYAEEEELSSEDIARLEQILKRHGKRGGRKK